MRLTISIVAATFAAVILTACGGGSSDDESSTDSCASAAQDETVKELLERCDPDALIPEPDEAQAGELLDELDAIAPGLAAEPSDTIDNARNTCSSILGGSENLVPATKSRFVGDGVEALTDTQAQGIIDAVRDTPWCAP